VDGIEPSNPSARRSAVDELGRGCVRKYTLKVSGVPEFLGNLRMEAYVREGTRCSSYRPVTR
jgi:hypothetical protein